MGGLRKTVFGRTKNKVNTYIGNIGTVYSTIPLLAAKLGIPSSSIKSFKITQGNISCCIAQNYVIPANCFRNSAAGYSPTYYYDVDGKVTELQISAFYVSLNTSRYYFPNAVSVGAQCFYNANYGYPDIHYQYLPKVSVLGTSASTAEAMWANGRKLVRLFISDSLRTANNGKPDQDLAAGAATHGLQINYLTGNEKTSPAPITDLMAGTVYKSALQLNFTAVSGVNAVLMYEVWIDGYYYADIYQSGQYIYGLDAENSYTVTLYTIDIYGNRSAAGNSITALTNNYSAIPMTGLQAYYKMDGSDPAVIADYLGVHNALNNGSAVTQPALKGSGYSLNGTTNYINIGNPPSFQFSTGSFAFWVKSSTTTNNPRALLTKAGAYTYNLAYGNLHGVKQICDGIWHLVVLNIGSGANNSQTYVDGELIWTGTINISSHSGDIIVGSISNGYGGIIDEFAVYNRKLNRQEQLLMFNNRKGSTI